MKLTSVQAASRLKVTGSTILNLIKSKRLTDVSGKTGRHEVALDSKELSLFAKTYKKRSRAYLNGNSNVAVESINHSGPAKLMSQLNRIETKLDSLIKMWS